MNLPVRRSIKNPTGTRRNFARLDWTSIGLRGARVTRGKARARPKLESSGSSLSHAHMEESRIVGFVAPAANSSLDSRAPPRRDWRGLLWIFLIMLAIGAAAIQVIK